MNRRRVCFFNSSKTWGGGEKWHYDIASRLSVKGHDVVVVTNRHSELFTRLKKEKIKCYRIRISNLSFLNLIKLFQIYRILRKNRIQTIILNLSSDLKIAGIAAKLAHVEKIIYRRGSAIPIKNTFYNRLLFRHVITGVIANSEATKKTILKHNPNLIEENRITVIYNGIDIGKFDANVAASLFHRKEGEIVLGTAGRLVRQKNQKYLISVAKILKNNKIPFKLLIAGEGELKDKLKKYAMTSGVGQNILFLGFVENIRDFFKSIDIFLLSSLWEGFGYVLIEAMASKKPVISLNLSNEAEIVKDHQTGYLIDENNIEGFAEKIELLARNRDLRKELGERGRKRVNEVFTIQNTLKRVEEVIL